MIFIDSVNELNRIFYMEYIMCSIYYILTNEKLGDTYGNSKI